MQTRSFCLLVAICQEWMAGATFRATPSLCASPTVVRFWSKWGSSHVHLCTLASCPAICHMFNLLRDCTYTHIAFDLHQDNTCLLLFKNGTAFRITVTSTEETKLCLHHLWFWPNICCLIYLLFHIFFIMSLSHFWSAFLISDKWSFGPSHHQQARPLPLIKL